MDNSYIFPTENNAFIKEKALIIILAIYGWSFDLCNCPKSNAPNFYLKKDVLFKK